MATTTTPNFGWIVPLSTELVKDGAVAIETLGDGIDASFVGLKGGTTGQVLSKTSATDLAFTWVAQDDSNAIQNAIVDAKGDLIGATAADTPARLAVGTDGQILTADSTAATGLAWATPTSTPTFVGCFVYGSANQSIPNGTVNIVPFGNEAFDSDNFHSTTTNNSRITIPTGKGGKYLVTGQIYYQGNVTGYRQIRITKNGTAIQFYNQTPLSADDTNNGSWLLSLAQGDYLELGTVQTSGSTLTLYNTSQSETFLSVSYQGA